MKAKRIMTLFVVAVLMLASVALPAEAKQPVVGKKLPVKTSQQCYDSY